MHAPFSPPLKHDLYGLQVHDAIILSLVLGSEMPPPRLELIKHLMDPAFSKEFGCQDPDCLHMAQREGTCEGNRLEVKKKDVENRSSGPLAFTEGRRIWLVIVHGKNDRRRSAASYAVRVPIPTSGVLHTLILLHLVHGRSVLAGAQHSFLFMNRNAKPFDDSGFSNYWQVLLNNGKTYWPDIDLDTFPPSVARTMFVDDFMRRFGHAPDLLEGASAVMGNTPQQWRRNYDPHRRGRLATAAVNHMEERTSGRRSRANSE